jgi:hypothetical protein
VQLDGQGTRAWITIDISAPDGATEKSTVYTTGQGNYLLSNLPETTVTLTVTVRTPERREQTATIETSGGQIVRRDFLFESETAPITN